MLHTYRSNRVDALLVILARNLAEQPLQSPISREILVAPSPAMARWANYGLAREHGIAANYWSPLPATLVWHLAGCLSIEAPEEDPLAIDRLAWKVFASLSDMPGDPSFDPLRGYLDDDPSGLKLWQLSARVADVFDRYQLYRPQLVRDWSTGKGDDWQAKLWRMVTAGVELHRVAVVDQVLQQLVAGDRLAGLPERVSLFAVSSLPPLIMSVFQALARHIDVDFYLQSPTPHFWSDLVSQKRLAQCRINEPENAAHWEVGNPLLASWGRQGQVFHDQFLVEDQAGDEIDAFVRPGADTLLDTLKQDVFDLALPSGRIVQADRSLQVHVCHSPMRECQVLHDQLLDALQDDPGLRPEDILVVIPEISRYAAYIEAAFGRDQDGRVFIPWNLSDIALQDDHPLVQVFLQLLKLPGSRFSHSEFVSYLDVPELAEHFGLTGEDVRQARYWLDQANLRWGLDAQHKDRLGLPGTEQNTWEQAGKRLFGGYALGAGWHYRDIAPVDGVSGSQAVSLGKLWRLFSTLSDYARSLAHARTPAEWQRVLGGLVDTFFGEREDDEGRLQKIRDLLADFAETATGMDKPVSLAVARLWIEQNLAVESRAGRYYTGGVTFCGMRPMRSVPFKMICVLGLQDQAFPRRSRPVEFDKLREQWTPGDPRPGEEDRYLFLETLLSAQQRLYISYVGRDLRRNTERQPSVLLRELLDYLDEHYPGEGNQRFSDQVTRVHPLQPFSPRNYCGEQGSFDGYWLGVAKALANPPAALAAGPTGWPGLRLGEPPETMRDVTLGQLVRFLSHPVRYFVNTRLSIFFRDSETVEDEEPFEFDGLEWFMLKQRMLQESMIDRDLSLDRLRAEGALPHAAFAEVAYQALQKDVELMRGELAQWQQLAAQQAEIDLSLQLDRGRFQLAGRVEGIYAGTGLLRYRPGKNKGAALLELWIHHLALCAIEHPEAGASRQLNEDGEVRFSIKPSPLEAKALLGRYLGLYWEGLQRPLPVAPGATYAYQASESQARAKWDGNAFQGVAGDRDDPYIQLVMRGIEGGPLDTNEFVELSEQLYGPIERAREPA